MAHPRFDPFSAAPATPVTVPLHLMWPARLGRGGPSGPPVPLIIFLGRALATPSDTYSLRAALARTAVVAAPSYAGRNFTPSAVAEAPAGGGGGGGAGGGGDPTAGRLFTRFLTNVADRGRRNGCPPLGVLSSARLINSVLAHLDGAAAASSPRVRGVSAAAAAAADPHRLVLAGHSMGAAIILAAASGGCAGGSAELTPFLSRVLCEGYTPPLPPAATLRGVVAYAASPPATPTRLPPLLWAVALDGDTPAAVTNLRSTWCRASHHKRARRGARRTMRGTGAAPCHRRQRRPRGAASLPLRRR